MLNNLQKIKAVGGVRRLGEYQKLQTSRRSKNKSRRKITILPIYPDDNLKIGWDICFFVILISVGLIIPFRLCFMYEENDNWKIYDYITDVLFGIDLILNFITAYYDEENNVVKDMKKIARNYLTGWFTIDVIAL